MTLPDEIYEKAGKALREAGTDSWSVTISAEEGALIPWAEGVARHVLDTVFSDIIKYAMDVTVHPRHEPVQVCPGGSCTGDCGYHIL